MLYSENIIDEIKNSNDIVDVVSQYITLRKSGRNYMGLCPFHNEKSPSFSVSPEKQIFHCFGCGVGGNSIHFTSKIENLNFRETIELMAERSGINLPTSNYAEDNIKQELKNKILEINLKAADFFHEKLYLPNSKVVQDYVKKRKLDNKTLKAFKIGYSGEYNELYNHLKSLGYLDEDMLASNLITKTDKGVYIDRFRKRMMFPIFDTRNRVIAFGGRSLDDSLPKYINTSENLVYNKGRNLYGFNIAKTTKEENVIIVEGYMDVVSLYQRGFDNVSASLGTALTEAQGRLLRNKGKVIIGYDSDGAGQTATLRGLEILQTLGVDVRVLEMEGAKDPDEYVIKYGTVGFKELIAKAISLIEFKVKVLKHSLNIENLTDKIKFLNEIAKILATQNDIEKEIYIQKISEDYNISKEAIYGEVNKIKYSQVKTDKVLENRKSQKVNIKPTNAGLNEKREVLIIKLLLTGKYNVYQKIEKTIKINNINSEMNKIIIEKIYNKFETDKTDVNDFLSLFEDEHIIGKIAGITAMEDLTDIDKCIEDVVKGYENIDLNSYKLELVEKLKNPELSEEEKAELEKALNETIIKMIKNK